MEDQEPGSGGWGGAERVGGAARHQDEAPGSRTRRLTVELELRLTLEYPEGLSPVGVDVRGRSSAPRRDVPLVQGERAVCGGGHRLEQQRASANHEGLTTAGLQHSTVSHS